MSQYVVGIDLGTTHSVLAYAAVPEDALDLPQVKVLNIPQLTQPGVVEELEQLPSFLYLNHEAELNESECQLPWGNSARFQTGALARNLGAKTPIRLVASAKSWLCHGGVDRKQAFLPLEAPEEVEKISPFETSKAYLTHLRNAWNHRFPDAPLEQQEIVITIPASFDPGARDLTAQAALELGFEHMTLLEEPQAALYSWIHRLGDEWRSQVQVGDVVLVVDVGGGTTDLTLVTVSEQEGNLELERVAVGEHLLLGGDNMDLALAYRIHQKLAQEGKQLQPWQIQAITHSCRHAKESILNDESVNEVPITVPSRGSKLLGSTLRSELTREDVIATLLEGFLPQSRMGEFPVSQPRGALTQMGLPYAQDAAITRHIAGFLAKQSEANQFAGIPGATQEFVKPTAILLNGGVFKAGQIQDRLISIINSWLQQAESEQARLLSGADLDLAVARGAAYYGVVRHGRGVRIRGGVASSYYVGIETAMPAVPGMPPPVQAICVAPFGMEEGTRETVAGREFGLVVGEPVQFKFFGSTTRRQDEVGVQLDYWQPGELEALPDIQMELPLEGRQPGSVVPVELVSTITEVGTLRLDAVAKDGSGRWQVEFSVREA